MAATAQEQNLGAKPTMLAVVFVLLTLFLSSISLLDAVYVVRFPFGATIKFSDRESSPDPSHSVGSSEEFGAETPGSDWEDDPSTIVLSDNEEYCQSRRGRRSWSISRLLLVVLCPSGELYCVASLQPAQLTMLTQV